MTAIPCHRGVRRHVVLPSSQRSKGLCDVLSESMLERVAQGDDEAVQACIDAYGGLVWSLARRYFRDAAEAEDAVQEIFLSLWKTAHRFDPKVATETTFVAMIARRRLIDRMRRNARQRETVGEVEVPTAATPGERVETSDEARWAAEAFSTLGDDQQRVLRMAIHHGLSHERIAESTGIPLGTVKTHIRRGLMKVREVLEERRAQARGRLVERAS